MDGEKKEHILYINQCTLCKKVFKNRSSLRRHVRNLHPQSLNDIAPLYYKQPENFNFNCDICGKNFNQNRSFKIHMKKTHDVSLTRSNDLGKDNVQACGKLIKNKCPLCDSSFLSKNEILWHYRIQHNRHIAVEKINFSNQEDFYNWKNKVEDETITRFVKKKDHICKEYVYTYFSCNRSGYCKPIGTGQRHLKTQGTSKINGFCPAEIKLKTHTQTKICNVEYISAHIGHQQDLGHLQLRLTERRVLAQKIATKVPFVDIINDIRNSVNDCSIRRIHLVNRKDLYNIEQSFNLGNSAVRHPNDAISVESWVMEMEKNEDCFIFYKPQGELLADQPQIKASDFILIIMTSAQIELLKKYGSDVICLDGTHGLNNYNFELTTIMVLDDLRQGFPCCFLLSNRGDKIMLSLFFSFVKSHVGILTPNIFMTDMAESFFNAWLEVMGFSGRRLFCTWHVLHAWKKNMLKIKTKEKRDFIFSQLYSMLNERDCVAFSRMLQNFCQNENPDNFEFIKYFKDNYSHNCQYWAHCYRIGAGINTNAHLERMHRTIKYIYLKGKNVKRLDKAISALMQFVQDKLFDRIISKNKGKLCSKIREIRARHKNIAQLDPNLIIKTANGWEIPSKVSHDIYFIQKLNNSCDCQLICSDCNICIHHYGCSCTDYAIKFNMCKHIHLLATHLKSNAENVFRDTYNITQQTEDQDNEKNIILSQVSKPPKSSLEIEKGKIREHFLTLLESVSSFEESEIIKRTLASLAPTLAAVKNANNYEFAEISQTPPNRKIPQQRRFWSTKKLQKKKPACNKE